MTFPLMLRYTRKKIFPGLHINYNFKLDDDFSNYRSISQRYSGKLSSLICLEIDHGNSSEPYLNQYGREATKSKPLSKYYLSTLLFLVLSAIGWDKLQIETENGYLTGYGVDLCNIKSVCFKSKRSDSNLFRNI